MDQVKLGISAPKEVKIYRSEIFEMISRENKEALEKSKSKINVKELSQKFDENKREG